MLKILENLGIKMAKAREVFHNNTLIISINILFITKIYLFLLVKKLYFYKTITTLIDL